MKIAVVIPALDESEAIPATLESIQGGARESEVELDLLVVDGGSTDATADLSRAYGARVITSAPGRARQLQAGLEASTGDVVVFIHADTAMPQGWADAIVGSLVELRSVGGAFEFAFDRGALAALPSQDRSALKRVELWARRRARWLGFVYGDQAIFAQRSALDAMGGVPQAAVMEDVDLVRGLRKLGGFTQLPLAVATSPRRYLKHGVRKTSRNHAFAILGWILGVPRPALKRWLGR